MAQSATLFALFIWLSLTIYLAPTQALTDCDAAEDSCICVWDLKQDDLYGLNGVYRKVNSADTGTDRQWMNDDFTSSVVADCPNKPNPEAKYFWHTASTGNYWYLGDASYIGTGTHECTCNVYNLGDPLVSTCPDSKYTCALNGERLWNSDTYPLLQDLYIEFGSCPDVTDFCTTIEVTSNTATECDGVYDAIAPLNGLDNQLNMYQNQNASASYPYIYFDTTRWRWICASEFALCGAWPTAVKYMGAALDAGTPDFTSIQTTGETWTVSSWGTLSAQASHTATFECNPPQPTSAPITSDPTSSSPTNDPSISPTNDPSVSPTRNPSVSPTTNPSLSPVGSPTDETSHPTHAPSLSVTNDPSVSPSDDPSVSPSSSPTRTPDPTIPPSVSPTRNPSVSPTLYPTKNPSMSPTLRPTRDPTRTGQTLYPTGSPSMNPSKAPTENTDTPSLSPLADGSTHAPVTAKPTTAAPVLAPTRLTYPPTDSPIVPTDAPVASTTLGPTEDRDSGAFAIVPSVGAMVLLLMPYLAFVYN